jgi:hypothetical protein
MSHDSKLNHGKKNKKGKQEKQTVLHYQNKKA